MAKFDTITGGLAPAETSTVAAPLRLSLYSLLMNAVSNLWGVALLLALAGCHDKAGPIRTAQPPAVQPPAALMTNSPGAAYDTYRGCLAAASDSFTLHLLTLPPTGGDGFRSATGYYYGPEGRLLELADQSTTSPDSLVLLDVSPETYPSGPDVHAGPRWCLRRQPNGDWAGTRAGQALHLRRLPPAAHGLALAVGLYADSLAAYPGTPRSPFGHVGLQGLLPTGPAAATGAGQALAVNFLRLQRGDTLPGQPAPATLAALWKTQRLDFARTYRAAAAESATAATADAADETPAYALRYQQSRTACVLVQQPPLLSVAFMRYNYAGGAHGYGAARFCSFDLRTGRALFFDDIFRPEARAQLPALLARYVRPAVGLSATEPLENSLFVAKMPVTTNVCLAPGGVVFNYTPYEIASYAQGEIRVFIPWAALRPLLRADLPLPGVAGG